MTVTPNGDLYLCKTKLENDYKNQFTWDNINTQATYFNGTVQNTFSDYTYMKKDSTVTVNANIDDIIDCNYLFYVNNGFTSKRYYCFIKDMVYVNENTTRITFETDCFQTWYFELQYNRCFVEREHVNDDTIGLHTVPELLEKGEFIPSDSFMMLYNNYLSGHNFCVCIGVSDNVFTQNQIKIYNNTYSGLQYIALEDSNSLASFLNYYSSLGKIEEVYTLFMIPMAFITNDITEFTWDSKTVTVHNESRTIKYKEVPSSYIEFELGTQEIARPSQLGYGNNKYTPKNKKLLTSEYVYILADNMCGSVAKYDYEYFSDPSRCTFQCKGAINSGCSIKMYPKNYKNIENNLTEGLSGAKLPVCSWVSDVYTNWLTQNGVNIGISLATDIMTLGMTKSDGGSSGSNNLDNGLSGASGIGRTISEVRSHYLAPHQAQGNINTGDIMFALGNISPMFYKMSIKKEFAEIIDNYFTMFGYKVNIVKVPNITGRRNWNYVKTIDCNFDGNIPQTDLNVIKQMFNNGVTLWHNPNNIYNYSLDNSII